jgi:SAM-dependent methyltransferase
MNYYHYPSILINFPFIIRLVYSFNWISQQRKWIVYKTIKNNLKKLPAGSTVADIGCGEGQYLIPFAKQFPHIQFIAIDNHKPNIDFVALYARYLNIPNITTMPTGIENAQLTNINFAWCISVLHYVPNDDKALQKIAHCKELLIYQPINYKIETLFYKWVLNQFSNYDEKQNRQHIYTTNQLLEKVNTFFTIKNTSLHYGKIGRITHEWQNGLFNIIFHGKAILKVFGGIILVITYPLILLGMLIDTCTPAKVGNGLFVHAISKKV